jgi:putative pyruvate formate lyase activating enzyme
MLPIYLEKLTLFELQQKAEMLEQLLIECKICPNECMVNRFEGEMGLCHSTEEITISSVGPHFGEETPLVGYCGSGTIFFSNCNLSCEFCQNYDISQMGVGQKISSEELADAMLKLQLMGCHNLNLVTPTHFSAQIVAALVIAIEKGFQIPIVYNCGGYESIKTIELLKDIIDIYMPDIKYSLDENAAKYSNVHNYWSVVKKAVREMHSQVGDLKISRRGIAQRGLLMRHLVLPNNMAGSERVIDFIADEISINSYLNIMDQYRPVYHANKFLEINRHISPDEYTQIVNYAVKKGLSRGFVKN